jgi:hypothetical protein
MGLKILEWNVQCAVGSSKYGRPNRMLMPLFPVVCDYDVVILTEFYRLKDFDEFNQQFLNREYATFITSEQRGHNDVFIAIRKRYKPKEIDSIDKEIMQPLDILGVKMHTAEGELSIIGLRFSFGVDRNLEMKLKYKHMGNVLESLTKKLRKMYGNTEDRVIIAGDFNNAIIRGKEEEDYNENEILTEYVKNGSPCDHQSFNFHVIKNKMKECGFKLITPKMGVSNRKSGNKIDHFAVKKIGFKKVFYLETRLSDHNQLIGEI